MTSPDMSEPYDASYNFDSSPKAKRGRPSKAETTQRQTLGSVTDTSYSPDKFYVSSTNEHDHDESVRIRLPKWVMVYMQDLVRDPRLPAFRSTHDVIRNALVHSIKYMHDNGITDADTDWIEREILRGAVARAAMRREDQTTNVAELRQMVADAIASRNPDEIEMAMAVSSNMAEHTAEPFRTEIRQMLDMAQVQIRTL